jgi:hypothetical protein
LNIDLEACVNSGTPSRRGRPRATVRPQTRLRSSALWTCLLSAGLVNCSRVVEPKGTLQAGDTAVAQAMQQQRKQYVQASIEIGCLTRHETDPRRVADETLLIYRRHGFEDVMSYLALVEVLGPDRAVQLELAEGLKNCP